MSDAAPLISDYVIKDLLDALEKREPRALELAFSLALTLPDTAETRSLRAVAGAGRGGAGVPLEISSEVRDVLQDAYQKFNALRIGDFLRVDLANPNVPAFERRTDRERLLLIHNLARVSQPVKFRDYADKGGWDILNRVEFIFPTRAQLEAYEFLWLMIE